MSEREAFEALIKHHEKHANDMETMARKILHDYSILYAIVHGPELFTKERIQWLMRKEHDNA